MEPGLPSKLIRFPAYWMRGGTSKGLFIHIKDFPYPHHSLDRDALLAAALGSPDIYGKQIDGLGGGSSSSSKVVLISALDKEQHLLECQFGQVFIGTPKIDFSGICGNLVSAIGIYALENQLLNPCEDRTYSTKVFVNTPQSSATVTLQTPVLHNSTVHAGTFEISGIRGQAAPIEVKFSWPKEKERILSTSNPIDLLKLDDSTVIPATLISAGSPTVFINAHTLGLNELKEAKQIETEKSLQYKLRDIQKKARELMGLTQKDDVMSSESFNLPRIALIFNQNALPEIGHEHIISGLLSFNALHHAYTATGAIALAAGALIPGTIIQQNLLRPIDPYSANISIKHISGSLSIFCHIEKQGNAWTIKEASYQRTARTLMYGHVTVPMHLFSQVQQLFSRTNQYAGK